LLLPLCVLDAERRLRHEIEPLVGYVSSADHAPAVFAPLDAPQRFVDEPDPRLEHRLARQIELACFGLARDVGGVLISEGHVAATLALRHGEALLDPFDRRCEIGAFALESLAHRISVHLASVRQNCLVVPEDVSKRRSELHLLDVREQDEWDAGHIEGSQHIPLGELGARLAEVPTEQVVVAVCRSGSRSDRAMRGLRQSGYEAENLDGGVTAWSRAGLALVAVDGRPGRVI
jgi:rhodanese-related sulfurtransferase